MKHLVGHMVDFFIAKEIVESEWKELYLHGFTLLFSEILNLTFILLIGGITGHFIDSAVYLLIFCFLRGFAGGFHAKKHWICRTVMIGSFAGALCIKIVLQSKALHGWGIAVLVLIAIICLGVISRLAPVPHPNKPLTETKRKINRCCAQFFALVCLTASILGALQGYGLGYMAFLAVIVVAVLMIVGKKKNKINKKF